MTWIFKPDGTVMEVVGWPTPYVEKIPMDSWAYPSPGGHWGISKDGYWVFPMPCHVPNTVRAKLLLLED